MIVGEIPGGHGDQAVTDRLPGYSRLFECHAFTCPTCGHRDHGNPSGANTRASTADGYQSHGGSHCPLSCWVDPRRRPGTGPHGVHHCAVCGVHVPLDTPDAYQDRHYHLAAALGSLVSVPWHATSPTRI